MRGGIVEERKTRRVLVCAATKWEALPLRRRLGSQVSLVQTGIGPRNARLHLEKTPAQNNFDLVISAGFCGALQPGMACGDLVLDVREAPAEWPPLAREIAQAQGARVHFGRMLHSDVVLSSPKAKRRAGEENRACAVDMETAEIKAWAAARGAQALAARVVLDSLDESLPEDVPQSEDFSSLLRYALSRPMRLPRLMRLGINQRKAIAVLGDFLAAFLEAI